MNQPLPDHLQPVIERICALGCQQVNECIDQLKNGRDPQHTRNLTPEDKRRVLTELISIMAVYNPTKHTK